MRGKLLGVFTAVVLFASVAVGTFVYLSSRPSSSVGNGEGFDISHVDAPKPVVVAPPPTPVEPPPPDFRTVSHDPLPSAGTSGSAVRPGSSAGSSSAPAADSPAREKEKAFLAAHGKELASYHAKLGAIAMQYYKTNPVVRDVDRAFAGMSRYMAVKRQFDRDRDPYKFARDAIALPEVRAEIARRVAQPAVWTAALGMISAAMKNPPPASLYNEAKRFMTGDDKVAGYVSEFTGVVTQNVPALVKGIPPGMDTRPFEKLANDVNPNSGLPKR